MPTAKESDDGKGGGSEMGRTPTGVDGLEAVCRHLPFNDGSDTTPERKQHHSLLDWLILRCKHQLSVAIHGFSGYPVDSFSFC